MVVLMESVCLICGRKELHRLDAEQLTARAPMVLMREVGMVRSPAEVERRCWREFVPEGGHRGQWGLVLECFEGEEEVFVVDAKLIVFK